MIQNIEMFECKRCGNFYDTKQKLLSHMNIHEDNRPTHTCTLCKKEDILHINKHMRNVHSDMIPEKESHKQCPICFKQILNSNGLITSHYKCFHVIFVTKNFI